MKYNFDNTYLYSLLNKAKFNQEVIDKMNAPFESKSWLEYKKHFYHSRENTSWRYFLG